VSKRSCRRRLPSWNIFAPHPQGSRLCAVDFEEYASRAVEVVERIDPR
jgi:hypothetical protein